MIDANVLKEYLRLRALGWTMKYALRAAKTRTAFAAAGDLVKLEIEPDPEPYDDSYVDTWDDASDAEKAREKAKIQKRLDAEGCCGIVGYYRTSRGEDWQVVDSVHGFIGDDWRDSGYDVDVMASALDALDRATHPGVPGATVEDAA